MADFSTPFANAGERRLATPDEKANGFPCGPADQALFNGLQYQIQAELKAIHDAAGVAGDDSVYNTTLTAINALIAAATGGGATEGYLLLAQARARLPIYPEVETVDGKMGITSPGAGVVRVPGAVTFLHRGIYQITTVLTDLNTDVSKTYHLRWNPDDGFALKDLASGVYNPGAVAETNELFDSSYDDMLVARITTNAGNAVTITDLVNRTDLWENDIHDPSDSGNLGGNPAWFDFNIPMNWARTPRNWSFTPVLLASYATSAVTDNDFALAPYGEHVTMSYGPTVSRYSFATSVLADFANVIRMQLNWRA